MKKQARLKRRLGLYASSAALAITGVLFTAPPASTADASSVNGSTAATAAASCWEIKEILPSAPSGVYWLLTPSMAAPEQFYCDQETEGGGWVLIGRGREGWKELYEGLGTTAQVRSNVTGTAAFTPRQLSSTTVDGLLNLGAPDQLEDGIRLRRAMDTGGTAWQEVRYKTANQPRWSWALGSATPVVSGSFDSTGSARGTTANFGADQGFRRVVTSEAEAQNWTQGFAYGRDARGVNSPSSYIWASTATAANPRPFTQMYLRPKLDQENAGFRSLPDSGAGQYSQQPRPDTGAVPTVWGVTGLGNGTGELNTEVQAFAQIRNTVYVAGNFKSVQRNASGSGRVDQSYLAGFDVNTGELVPGFRPLLNGQVRALTALPNGGLAIGGTFTTVNGVATGPVAVIDPVTGAADPGFRLGVENRVSGAAIQIRSLEARENWLYMGGAFTHLTGSTGSPVYARSAARVNASTGQPDGTWNPAFNGTVVDVDPSDNGQRLYAAGYFTSSNNASTYRAAAIGTTAGAPAIPWNFVPSSGERAGYQQGIEEVGSRVWVGGAEHSLFSFDTATLGRESANITLQGGDFQDVSAANGIVYGSCHCGHWNYSGGSTWPSVGSNFQMADKINLIGAWDAQTGEYIPGFNPVMKGRAGYGIWAAFVDTRGILWAGGDLVSSTASTGANQWSGGYARFAPADSVAPSTPAGLAVTTADSNDTLTWSASAGAPTVYQVLRNDRVIASTTATRISVPSTDGARYYVRAADAAGNYSATTPVAKAQGGVAPPVQSSLIDSGSQWKYRFDTAAPPTGWTARDFDDSVWATGVAPLGWGSASLGTTLTAEGTKPLSSHYRRSVQVSDPSRIESATLTTRADDGVVIYVNGAEVARRNMPAGTISSSTYATAAPSTAAAIAAPIIINLPVSAFVAGTNVISAEVHSNYRATPTSSFELTASVRIHP